MSDRAQQVAVNGESGPGGFWGTLGLSVSTKALHCLYQWSVAKHKMKNFRKAQRSREWYAVKRKGNWHGGS